MLTWLIVNLALTALALAFIALNATAPHRLRFFAGFAALVAWLVPWPLLPELLPANMFSFELWRMERAVEATSTRLTGVVPVIVQTSATPVARGFIILTVLELCFIVLILVGCVLFVWKLAAHRLLLHQLARQGSDGNWLWARAGLVPVCPVGVQRAIAGAFSSGLLRPRIWVHGDLVHSPQLATLLRHELTHIRQYDNWYLLVCTLVERLFWWNPLVWYLGHVTRELQELSCDERCQRVDSTYPAQLAQLMIDSARNNLRPRQLALGANIFNNPHPNVKRIKRLQRSYPMLKRHILGAALTAGTALLAVGLVTAQPDNVQAVAGERVTVFRLERGAEGAGVPLVVNASGDTSQPLHVARGMERGALDQFVRIDMHEGEQRISFQFSDSPLPTVLAPLLGLVRGGMAPLPLAVQNTIVHKLEGEAATVFALPAEGVVRVVRADTAAATWTEEGEVVAFTAATPPTGMFVAQALGEGLVLEYPEAADRLVSVNGSDLTLDDALDLIAAESGCNIFQDRDTIVVDWCAEP